MELREYYDKVYSDGKEKYWNDLQGSTDGLGKSHHFIIEDLKKRDYAAKFMLDFGCGEGEFLEYFNNIPNRVGIDFSKVGIEHAMQRNSKVHYLLGSENKIPGCGFDLITSVGVLEHVDNPEQTFKTLYSSLNEGGLMYLVCPSHYNIRGVIWQALNVLLNVPMSLADRHVIGLEDIKFWIGEEDVSPVLFRTIDSDVVMGEKMIQDLLKRLTNALGDAKLPNDKVLPFLRWLEEARHHFTINEHNGCEAVYIIKKY